MPENKAVDFEANRHRQSNEIHYSQHRLAGLEQFLEFWPGPSLPEYGEPEDEMRSIEMLPPLLARFFSFAGWWPGHNQRTSFAN